MYSALFILFVQNRSLFMLHEDYLVRQIDVMVKYLAETVFKKAL